jgi:hypothetical protein
MFELKDKRVTLASHRHETSVNPAATGIQKQVPVKHVPLFCSGICGRIVRYRGLENGYIIG